MAAKYSSPGHARPSATKLPGMTALTVARWRAISIEAVRGKPSWPTLEAP
jgi:hypothetical protein